MNSREKLLDVAFDIIYKNGYSATSIDMILKESKMNKGSVYHYFKSKKLLTLAVIEEKLSSYISNKYEPLLKYEKRILNKLLEKLCDKNNFDFINGCKLNNLVQELSSFDKDFKLALEKIYFNLENIFEQVLNNAKKAGELKHNDTKALAIYIVASFEGCLITAKKSQDAGIYQRCMSQLELFLKTLEQ